MIAKEELNALIAKEKTNDLDSELSMSILTKFVNVSIGLSDSFEPFYTARVQDVLRSSIPIEELERVIVNGGWSYDNTKENIIKFN